MFNFNFNGRKKSFGGSQIRENAITGKVYRTKWRFCFVRVGVISPPTPFAPAGFHCFGFSRQRGWLTVRERETL